MSYSYLIIRSLMQFSTWFNFISWQSVQLPVFYHSVPSLVFEYEEEYLKFLLLKNPIHRSIKTTSTYLSLWRIKKKLLCPYLWGFFLTLSQTSPGFYVSAVQVFWKHCGKRRNCSWWAISPFPTVFSTVWMNFLPFSSILELSSANSSNLEESKICRLGKG